MLPPYGARWHAREKGHPKNLKNHHKMLIHEMAKANRAVEEAIGWAYREPESEDDQRAIAEAEANLLWQKKRQTHMNNHNIMLFKDDAGNEEE